MLPLQVGGYAFLAHSLPPEGLEAFAWQELDVQREWHTLVHEITRSLDTDEVNDNGPRRPHSPGDGRALLQQVHSLAQALSATDEAAADGEAVPFVRHAAGKPPGALAAELNEPAPMAMLRALGRQMPADAQHPLREIIACVAGLQQRLSRGLSLLRQMASILGPSPPAAPLLGVVSVAFSLRELSSRPEHEGAAAARQLWVTVRPVVEQWQTGPYEHLFSCCVADLSQHAHTLALNIHRALLAMGDGTVNDCTALQGVDLAPPAQAVSELLHPRRLGLIRYLAASGDGGNAGMRWAALLSQQLLACLARLRHYGAIPDPSHASIEKLSSGAPDTNTPRRDSNARSPAPAGPEPSY